MRSRGNDYFSIVFQPLEKQFLFVELLSDWQFSSKSGASETVFFVKVLKKSPKKNSALRAEKKPQKELKKKNSGASRRIKSPQKTKKPKKKLKSHQKSKKKTNPKIRLIWLRAA